MRLPTITPGRYVATIAVLLLGTCVLRADNTAAKAKAEKNPIRIGGTYRENHPVVEEWLKAFVAKHKELKGQFKVSKWYRNDNIMRFTKGECDVLVHYYLPLTEMDRLTLMWKMPKEHSRLETFLAGQARVIVVVHQLNPIKHLAASRVRDFLASWGGRKVPWRAFGGSSEEITSYGEKKGSWSRIIVRDRCLNRKDKKGNPIGYWHFRKEFKTCYSVAGVIKKVRKDRNGIGFFLYDGKPIKGVKILAIGEMEKGPFVEPKLGPWIQEDYPLSEPLILYLHPKAPPLAKKFCEFCISEEGAKIAAKHGLITPWHQKQAEGLARLKEMKAGKGVRIGAIGVKSGQKLMKELAVDYVKAKAVIQMRCAPADEMSAMGYFLTDRKGSGMELLLLNGKPSQRAMKIHGKKWEAL